MRAARRVACVCAALLVLVAAGCGSGSSSSGDLTVSAASSLTSSFNRYAGGFHPAAVRLSFGGSDQLAAQIEQGVRPDVFASANTQLPATLFARGLVERPVVFATNRLVIAVPAGSTRVGSLADLERRGVTIAIGSPSVPVGVYTRKVLARLGPAQSHVILADVRSEEPDVAGIVGKLTQGAVDAGFVYVTDVEATHGQLRAIPLPASLQPSVAYAAAVVRGSHNARAASEFIAGLVHGGGQSALRAAGFGPPPQ